MKKILCVVTTLLLLLPILTSCNHPAKKVSNSLKSQISQPPNNDTNKYKFAIYLVKDLSTFDATKTNLDKLPLENEPIITEKNISAYYWKRHVFQTDESVFNVNLMKFNKLSGTPYVLIANGERVYLGTLWSPASSMFPPEGTPVLDSLGSALIMDNLKKDGYNVIPKSNEVYLEISAPYKGKDNRSEMRIYNALKDVGILKE